VNPDLAPGALQKPAKGTAHAERVQKRMAVESHEDREKTKARKRDGYRCRWPGCDCFERRDRIEVAHIEDKGMGGDHGLRSDADMLICLCVARHQGRPSLHSGDLRIEPLTVAGTNGPCAFWKVGDDGREYLVAQERAPFVYERD
jgi:hypothetical protein